MEETLALAKIFEKKNWCALQMQKIPRKVILLCFFLTLGKLMILVFSEIPIKPSTGGWFLNQSKIT